MIDIARLRELCREATPGPWKSIKSVHGSEYRFVQIGAEENYTTLELLPGDANHIAALSPDTVLRLLDAWEALVAVVASGKEFTKDGPFSAGATRFMDAHDKARAIVEGGG